MPSARPTNTRNEVDGGRNETAEERADRNWSEVLQELRVMQTGTQILTGFLLSLAFQPAFADLDDRQRTIYLCLVVVSALSSIVSLAPVALHRVLFQKKAKREVVSFGHIALTAALVTVSVLLVGVVGFVFDVVVDQQAGIVAAVALTLVIAALWVVVPVALRVTVRNGDRR